MKAAAVTGRRRFEIRELPTPEVQPGTLLIREKRCAICGTDLEYVDHPRWDESSAEYRPRPQEAVPWDTNG